MNLGDRAMTMSRTPEEFLAQPYGRLLVREPEGGFSAEILEFPGCIAEGDTAEEAVANVERAAKAWIASELEQQHRIPTPVSGGDYSGRLLVRLPRSLHRSLALKAASDNTSLNQEVVAAVACWVGADDLYRRLTENVAMQASSVMVHGMIGAPQMGWSMFISGGQQAGRRADPIAIALRQLSQSQPTEPTELLVGSSD